MRERPLRLNCARSGGPAGEAAKDEVAMIEDSADYIDATRFYKVDLEPKTLAEAAADEDGVTFGVEGEVVPNAAEATND